MIKKDESMKNLSKVIHRGIIKAQKDYIRWADLGIGHSAEYLLVSNIAQSISSLQYTNDIDHIFVEYSIKDLADIDGLEDNELRTGRCDICVEDKKTYSIIEVKNTLTSVTDNSKMIKAIVDDIKRMELFLKNDNCIKKCYLCFINANYIKDKEDNIGNRKIIKKKITGRLKDFTEIISKEFIHLKFSITDNDFIEQTSEKKIWGWQSVVIKITNNELD